LAVDPATPGRERYWNGLDWTATRPTPAPGPFLPAWTLYTAIGACGAIIIGWLGPWASILGIVHVNGTRVDGSQILLLAGAGSALALVLAKGQSWADMLAIVAAGIGAAFAIWRYANVNSYAGTSKDIIGQTATVEWGLYVAIGGCLALAGVCAWRLWLQVPRGA
jgi:hypothetical protein